MPTGSPTISSERLDGLTDSRFTVDPDHLDAVIGRLHAAGIHTLTVTPPSLDALFLRNYGQGPGPDETAGDGSLAEASPMSVRHLATSGRAERSGHHAAHHRAHPAAQLP